MPSQQAIIRDDDVVPNGTIVPDMRSTHQKIFVADSGDTALRAAAMDRAVFADDVVVADFYHRFSFRRKGKILRWRANDRAVSDEVSAADRYLSFDHHM